VAGLVSDVCRPAGRIGGLGRDLPKGEWIWYANCSGLVLGESRTGNGCSTRDSSRPDYISTEISTMTSNDQDNKPDSVAFHLVAIIAGLVMMVLGLGLGVTMVLLPLGLVLGLAGLVVLVWGLTPGWRK
jgi:hypothetical protein